MTPLRGLRYWAERFGKTRKRLYWLTVSFNAFAFSVLLAAALLGDGVEPCCPWLPELVGFVIPGLPANLVELWAKFFWPVALLVLIDIAIAVVNRSIRVEEDECAFHAAQLNLSGGQPSYSLKPVFSVRCIAWISPVFPAISALMLAASVIYLSAIIALMCAPAETGAIGCEREEKGVDTDTPTRWCGTGARRLGAEEAVSVIVTASRARNNTGLLVGKGECYQARYLTSHGWRDGDIPADSRGFRYSGLKQFLAWWLEWLRPYPEGSWFQLVGRVGASGTVFPVLVNHQDIARTTSPFRAPRDGELILLVNDVWYSNNTGFMVIEIRRLDEYQTCGSDM